MTRQILTLGFNGQLLGDIRKGFLRRDCEITENLTDPGILDTVDTKSPVTIVADADFLTNEIIDRIETFKKNHPEVFVILTVSRETKDLAIDAIEEWANDYIVKPYSSDEVIAVIKRNLSRQEIFLEALYLRKEVSKKYAFENIITKNSKMQKIFDLITAVAETDATVLVQGETGTGKELVARAIHYNSPRRLNRFVVVNCGSLPDTLLESELFGHEKGAFTGATQQHVGKFEFANKGTIFFDEIGDISPAMQLKLLRVLQEREFERVGGNKTFSVDVRVIAASNKDLEIAVDKGTFREDLYYRINVVRIHLPPLRERKEDIPLLTAHFLKRYREANHKDIKNISQEAMETLINYPWPGNIRELANVIERAVIIEKGPAIKDVDLPIRPKATVPANNNGNGVYVKVQQELPLQDVKKGAVEEAEKEYLKRVLTQYKGSIKRTACHARLTPRSIHAKMSKYGLKKEVFKSLSGLSVLLPLWVIDNLPFFTDYLDMCGVV